MKFKEYPQTKSLAENDAFIIDSNEGTKHILTHDAAVELIGSISPQVHSRIFRGKNLGSTITDEQKAAIKDGSFKDLFLGDYWVINDVNWRIVDMDYWYNTGYSRFKIETHHLVIVPDSCLGENSVMNEQDTTEGGYVGSYMHTNGLNNAKEIITEIFGDMVLEIKEYLSNAVTDGVVTGMASTSCTVELLSEIMLFGTNIFSPGSDGSGLFNGMRYDKTQLALFDVAPRFIIADKSYFLRDIASSGDFVAINQMGATICASASGSSGVRPVFSIC